MAKFSFRSRKGPIIIRDLQISLHRSLLCSVSVTPGSFRKLPLAFVKKNRINDIT